MSNFVCVAVGKCWQDRGSVSQSPTRTQSSPPSTSRGRMACCVTSPWSLVSRSSTPIKPSWQRAAITSGWVLDRIYLDVLQMSTGRLWGCAIKHTRPFVSHVEWFDCYKGFVQAYISIKSRYQSGSVAHCWCDGGDNMLHNHLRGR